LGACGLAIDKLLREHALDFVRYELKFFLVSAINSEIEAKAEETLFSDLQFVSEFFGILNACLFAWVSNFALF
jgi:hypothetical protein